MSGPRLVGMIHLPALPGTAASRCTLAEILDAALADALVLAAAGFDGVLVQNSLDRPTRQTVDILTVAQMTAVTTRVRQATDLAVGVNIVKNDGPAAVAIAAATDADFVRVKVLTGAVLSAEGIVQGCAAATHDLRRRSGSAVEIWADVYEPTSRPLLDDDFAAALVDTLDFGSADAVIVTGATTTDTLELARRTRTSRPGARIVIGGRISAPSLAEAFSVADSVIVGSALKRVPGIEGRVDPGCAREIMEAAHATGWVSSASR